jgi:phosphoglycerate dehydrogenase-like enzyme
MSRETTVLFIWEVDERLRSHLKSRLGHVSDIDLIFPSATSQEDLVKLAPKADIIVGWRPSKKLLLAAKKLQLFINPGAGVQHLIDLFREVTRSRKILLTNCHGNSYFVAQHAMGLLLALTNKIIPHHNWMVAGEWRKRNENAKSLPLRERRIGLLGYGAVNQKVHRFLSGFDLEFSILRREWSRQSTQLPTPAKKYKYPELQKFLDEINTLIVAVPLTSLTQDLIRMRELKLLGSTGLLVNVARGNVVNEQDLFKALENNVIAGAAIDVWYNYNPHPDSEGRNYPFSHPFHKLRNVVLSPHRAGSSFDNLKRWDEVIENIKRFAEGANEFINVVDLKKEY